MFPLPQPANVRVEPWWGVVTHSHDCSVKLPDLLCCYFTSSTPLLQCCDWGEEDNGWLGQAGCSCSGRNDWRGETTCSSVPQVFNYKRRTNHFPPSFSSITKKKSARIRKQVLTTHTLKACPWLKWKSVRIILSIKRGQRSGSYSLIPTTLPDRVTGEYD